MGVRTLVAMFRCGHRVDQRGRQKQHLKIQAEAIKEGIRINRCVVWIGFQGLRGVRGGPGSGESERRSERRVTSKSEHALEAGCSVLEGKKVREDVGCADSRHAEPKMAEKLDASLHVGSRPGIPGGQMQRRRHQQTCRQRHCLHDLAALALAPVLGRALRLLVRLLAKNCKRLCWRAAWRSACTLPTHRHGRGEGPARP